MINLKDLNKNIPYLNFRMEGLFPLKEMLLLGDLIGKIDLKDSYFSIHLAKKSRKHVRFQWMGLLYEFLRRRFDLSSAPWAFTKLMKIPISLLRRLSEL